VPVPRFAMLGSVNIEPLRGALLRDWEEVWAPATTGTGTRHDFNFLFPGLVNAGGTFPGLLNAKLLFSGAFVGAVGSRQAGILPKIEQQLETCLVFPLWRQFAPQILPILDEVLGVRLGLGNLSRHVWRVQFNRMPSASQIKPHVDQGRYSEVAHRVHIPLIIPRCIRFEQAADQLDVRTGGSEGQAGEWLEVPMRESEAFEVNNKIRHQVRQSGPYERVTLIIDVAEQPCARYVEVSSACQGWEDPSCVSDFHVDPAEWRRAPV